MGMSRVPLRACDSVHATLTHKNIRLSINVMKVQLLI